MDGLKAGLLAGILPAVLTADILTKQWALDTLDGGNVLRLLGGAVPLTLAYNTGAAFSIGLGPASRWIFLALTMVALVVLVRLYHRTPPSERLRLFAIALLCGGAIGNAIDRMRWDGGVVDFIGPIDLGFMLWPIFNVADVAITTGAVLLALSIATDAREPVPTTR